MRLMRLRRIRTLLPSARAAHAHAGSRSRRLLRLAFHQLSPQHPDLRIRHHGASPSSISRTRRQDGDHRPIYLSDPEDLIVADQASLRYLALQPIGSRLAKPLLALAILTMPGCFGPLFMRHDIESY